MDNQLFISTYMLLLPDKATLKIYCRVKFFSVI